MLKNLVYALKSNFSSKFNSFIDFDGIWIDMNEPSNFVNDSVKGGTNSFYDNPPKSTWGMFVLSNSMSKCSSIYLKSL